MSSPNGEAQIGSDHVGPSTTVSYHAEKPADKAAADKVVADKTSADKAAKKVDSHLPTWPDGTPIILGDPNYKPPAPSNHTNDNIYQVESETAISATKAAALKATSEQILAENEGAAARYGG